MSSDQIVEMGAVDSGGRDLRLLDALSSLNEIGMAVNRLAAGENRGIRSTLQLIVDHAIKVIPGGAAIIYPYDMEAQVLDSTSRVVAGTTALVPPDSPRRDGFGTRAIRRRQRVLSDEALDIVISSAALAAGVRSVACFPLVIAEQPVGVLSIYTATARQYGEFELLVIDGLVNYAAMAIHQARRLGHVQRDLIGDEDALNRLWRAGMLISSRLGLDDTLKAILQMALDVTNAHYGIFRLLDDSGAHLETRALAGASGRPQINALPVDGSSIMGWVAVHRQPLCIHDLEAAPWVQVYRPLDADLRMRSELAVPLIGSSGRLEGVLNLESPEIGAFGDQDRHLIQSLATQAVIAIQEARLLDALLEVARLLLIQPYPRVFQHLVTQACNLLNAAASALWVLEGENLVLAAATYGTPRSERLPLRGSLTGLAVIRRAPVMSEDVRDDPRFHRVDLAQQYAWTRALIVPLLSSDDGQAIGALSVYSVQGESSRFTESEWDEKVLTCLAYYAALALQNADHQQALRLAQERQAVAETFAAIGDVAANALHHLNNKVGAIPVRVQGIQDKCQVALLADDYLASNLKQIGQSAREAMEAVRDSLTHLRPINPAPVSLMRCVIAALDEAQLPRGVEVEIQTLEGLPPVVAHQRSLIFVFVNLLDNAVAAMQGSGTIRVRGWSTTTCIAVTVADDGPGIAAELHERIFEFTPPEKMPERNGKLGFGLWWVKTLLMRLGGSISVESDGEHGATFQLRLPRAETSHV